MTNEDDMPEDVRRGVEKALSGERPGYPTVSLKKRYRFPGPSERVLKARQEAQMSVYEEPQRKRGDE